MMETKAAREIHAVAKYTILNIWLFIIISDGTHREPAIRVLDRKPQYRQPKAKTANINATRPITSRLPIAYSLISMPN